MQNLSLSLDPVLSLSASKSFGHTYVHSNERLSIYIEQPLATLGTHSKRLPRAEPLSAAYARPFARLSTTFLATDIFFLLVSQPDPKFYLRSFDKSPSLTVFPVDY
jgi:hypothetical protein